MAFSVVEGVEDFPEGHRDGWHLACSNMRQHFFVPSFEVNERDTIQPTMNRVADP